MTERIEKSSILKNMDGPKIFISEIEDSLHKLKRNKAAVLGKVVTEMMIALNIVESINQLISLMKFIMLVIYPRNSVGQSLSHCQKILEQLSANCTDP